MVTIWGNQNFHIVDLRSMQITYQIMHPIKDFEENPKNWGIRPFLYNKNKLQYVISRDNLGFCLIDVRNKKAYTIKEQQISQNLFGHGQILEITDSEIISVSQIQDKAYITTL